MKGQSDAQAFTAVPIHAQRMFGSNVECTNGTAVVVVPLYSCRLSYAVPPNSLCTDGID